MRNLRKAKGYISSQIDLVLREGADDDLEKKRDKTNFGDRFEVWYYYGEATKEDLEAADCTCGIAILMMLWLSLSIIALSKLP